MIDKQVSRLSAVQLRFILILVILILTIGSAVGFWVFHQHLMSYATQVNTDNAAAASSSNDLVRLQKLQTYLENNKVAVTRAKNIVADSKYYQYQTQIINDINSYAAAAGVTITGYTFGVGDAAGTQAVATPTAPTAVPIGLKTTTATVAIKSPVDYQTVMNFLHSIELNLTKMNITSISLTGGCETGSSNSSCKPNQVSVNPIGIEVYTQ